jgi:outer membrane lipoprotein-sorting protein
MGSCEVKVKLKFTDETEETLGGQVFIKNPHLDIWEFDKDFESISAHITIDKDQTMMMELYKRNGFEEEDLCRVILPDNQTMH